MTNEHARNRLLAVLVRRMVSLCQHCWLCCSLASSVLLGNGEKNKMNRNEDMRLREHMQEHMAKPLGSGVHVLCFNVRIRLTISVHSFLAEKLKYYEITESKFSYENDYGENENTFQSKPMWVFHCISLNRAPQV